MQHASLPNAVYIRNVYTVCLCVFATDLNWLHFGLIGGILVSLVLTLIFA